MHFNISFVYHYFAELNISYLLSISYSKSAFTTYRISSSGCNCSYLVKDVSCTECTGHGYQFELNLTVKMETRYSVEGSFTSVFPSTCNRFGVMVV